MRRYLYLRLETLQNFATIWLGRNLDQLASQQGSHTAASDELNGRHDDHAKGDRCEQ